MSTPGSQRQWYLARDGQQHGPLSDAELAKFIELGHLQPSDLLWREGFSDWCPAMVVFPPNRDTHSAGHSATTVQPEREQLMPLQPGNGSSRVLPAIGGVDNDGAKQTN